MTMLSPSEFTAGRFRDAKPMTLFMPGSKSQFTALIVGREDNKLQAIILDGQRAFMTFDCTTNDAWQGMLVHPVAIEVDEKTLFDLDRFDAPLGSVSRKGDSLNVRARQEVGFVEPTLLLSGLPTNNATMEVGFTTWRVVVGLGVDKRALFTVERPKPSND